MCLLMSIHGPRAVTRAAEILQITIPAIDVPVFWVASGFDHPLWPVLMAGAPPVFGLPAWGLVPFWTRNATDAAAIRNKTLNARAETILEKPAFREAARDGRCLILLDGFFEYHKHGGDSYPFYIHLRDGGPILVAGVASSWNDPESGKAQHTFSLITTAANAMMAEIHNDKRRMPAILDVPQARRWLDPGRQTQELAVLLETRDIPDLVAHPVSKLVGSRTADRNVPAVQEPFTYPELSSLFTRDGSAPMVGS